MCVGGVTENAATRATWRTQADSKGEEVGKGNHSDMSGNVEVIGRV